MLRIISVLLVVSVWACAAVGQGEGATGRLRVSAAVSLTEPLERLAGDFRALTGSVVELNLAGSSTLAAQLLAGAPVDLFISADQRQMDRVIAAGLVESTSPVPLLSNQLVFVVPADAVVHETGPALLLAPAFRRIAIGDPSAVPAGVYTRTYLESLELWGRLSDRIVPTRSVRAALAIVEMGAVDAGIVYRTDALVSASTQVVFEVPVSEGPAIVYPAAMLSAALNPGAAKRLLAYLEGPAAQAVFKQAGFIVSEGRSGSIGEVWEPAVAWVLARWRFTGRVVLETLVSLPLVLPPVATGLILIAILGRRGPLGRLFAQLGIELMFTWRAVVVAMAVMALPLLVRSARAGFEQVDRRYEQIAATLGAGPVRVFFTVTLPLARRGLLSGALLGFSRALGEFGATIMVAGALPSTRTIAVAIYTYTETGQQAAAALLLVVSATIAFGALLLSNRLATV